MIYWLTNISEISHFAYAFSIFLIAAFRIRERFQARFRLVFRIVSFSEINVLNVHVWFMFKYVIIIDPYMIFGNNLTCGHHQRHKRSRNRLYEQQKTTSVCDPNTIESEQLASSWICLLNSYCTQFVRNRRRLLWMWDDLSNSTFIIQPEWRVTAANMHCSTYWCVYLLCASQKHTMRLTCVFRR